MPDYPMLVIYNPPTDWQWPERFVWRPRAGDILPVAEVTTMPRRVTHAPVPYYKVWYVNEDVLCLSGVYASSAIVVNAVTATESALSIMRDRMAHWLLLRNAKMGKTSMLYSQTSMAADVAWWLADNLDEAMELCAAAGWPADDDDPEPRRARYVVNEHGRLLECCGLRLPGARHIYAWQDGDDRHVPVLIGG